MKLLSILVCCLALAGNLYGQGTVYFSNRVRGFGFGAPVFGVNGLGDSDARLDGPGYVAELYAGPPGTSEANLKAALKFLSPQSPTPFATGPTGAGYFDGGALSIPKVAAGRPATVQVRAWKLSSGASWETAGIRGQSTLFNVTTGGVGSPPSPPAYLTGLDSFSLQAVGPFSDDFADGNDDGWKHYDVLPAIGGKAATFEVRDGAYHIHAPASAVTSTANPPRAGGFLPDEVLTDFETAVDVIAWDDSTATEFGLFGRTRNLGLGKTDGYSFLCSPQRKRIAIYIGHGESGYTLAIKNMTMDPTHHYRMVFSGVGELLTAKLTDLTETSIPDVTLSARDSAYPDGLSGLITLTYKAGVDADATFDNYVAKVGSTDAPSLDLGPAPGMLFANAVHYPVGKGPWGPAIGDFNGDGKPDLIIANSQANSVSVLVGNGDGTFQAKKDTAVGARPQFVAVGDLNGDQKLDAAVSNLNDNTASVLLGNGDGTFQAKVDYPVSTKPVAIAVVDLNHDRILDMVAMNLGSSVSGDSTLSVLLGKGDGTFQAAVSYPAGDGNDTVRIEDLNQDTRPDLLTREGSNIWVLLGKGDGTFQSESKTPLPGALWDFTTGDFNADGKIDVAATSSARNAIYILLGQGDGSFAAPRTFSAPGPTFIYAADLDGDGALDLIIRGNSGVPDDRGRASQQITVLRGLGDGRFQQPGTVIRCGGYPGPMVMGDLNGDQRPDLVSINGSDFWSSVFLNQGPATGAAGRLEFSWPTITPGFVLEGGPEAGGPWTAVQTAPKLGHGPVNTVELDKSGEHQFFRLRKAP